MRGYEWVRLGKEENGRKRDNGLGDRDKKDEREKSEEGGEKKITSLPEAFGDQGRGRLPPGKLVML